MAPIRVAIVGGGVGGMTAAYELSRPEHHGKYAVTVYQQGWRLGGKGASGRGLANRIEEHGFHVWLGFYDNAFRMMRECYAALGRDRAKCRIAAWRDAFVPAPFIGLTERNRDASFSSLISYFPPAEGFPGDPLSEHDPFTIRSYLVRAANALRAMLLTVNNRIAPREEASTADPGLRSAPSDSGILDRLTRLLKVGVLATSAGLIEGIGLLQTLFSSSAPIADGLVASLLEAMAATVRRQVATLVTATPDLRTLWQAIDLSLTSILGMVRFGLISDPRGFDAINDYDFRAWLRLNGASAETLNSPLLRGVYDMAFAYEDGDYARPRQGAGVGLRGAMRMLFSYRGAMVWKMTAGMGDIVFAPLYELLKRRGVTFEFFHRLENVRLNEPTDAGDATKPYVAALEFDVQANTRRGAPYEPLIDVDGLPCWPSAPDYAQLRGGEKHQREGWQFESHWDRRKVGTKTLRVTEDFDFVVLAVSVASLPFVGKEVLARDQRWRDMVQRVKTVETQAFQIWSRESLEALGWPHPPVSLSGFVQPFESFADMPQLIKEENWPQPPGSIVYFLSTMPDGGSGVPSLSDTDYPRRKNAEVKANAVHFLRHQVGKIWPGALDHKGHFRWDLLVNPEETGAAVAPADESRIASQFWRANVDPSERYVLSVPGSQKYRISPLDKTYDNLTIAGDWTACGMDSGCVEAAVISGRLAAHALSSLPKLDAIVAYDHP